MRHSQEAPTDHAASLRFSLAVILWVAMLTTVSVPRAVREVVAQPSGPAGASAEADLRLTGHRLDQSAPCPVMTDKAVWPDTVALGETVGVTLTVRMDCVPGAAALHAVLLLDASGSVAGTTGADLRAAAIDFVRQFDLPSNPSTRLGIVQFSDRARALSPLTNDEAALLQAIQLYGRAARGTNMSLGLTESLRVLRQGRADAPAQADLYEAVVLITDGKNNAGCGPVLSAADQAHGERVMLVAACLGGECDVDCMRRAASSPRYFYQAPNASSFITSLRAIVGQLDDAVSRRLPRRVTVTDTLGADMLYVASSAAPQPFEPARPDRWLMWDERYPSATILTYTLKVRPLKTGQLPTNERAVGELVDVGGHRVPFGFSVPMVRVVDPGVRPTPTWASWTLVPPSPTRLPAETTTPSSSPATATSTSTPDSATPTGTGGPAPTTTSPAVQAAIYVPYAVREPPLAELEGEVELAVVVDVSPSMMEQIGPTGPSKLAAVRDSLGLVAGLLKGSESRAVALITFDSLGRVVLPLTSDAMELRDAVGSLEPGEYGSRLDLGIRAARIELEGGGHQAGRPRAILLITDGRAAPPGNAAAAAEAELARREMALYAIAVGTDVATDTLDAVVGDSGRLLLVDDAGRVAEALGALLYDMLRP